MPTPDTPVNVIGQTPANNPANSNSTVSAVAGVTGTAFTAAEQPKGPAQLAGLGVFGTGQNGVQGTSASGTGVQGASSTGSGVVGMSDSTTVGAIHAVSTGFDGAVGETSSPAHAGVTGRNTSTSPGPYACGVYGTGGTYAGKFDGNLQVNGNSNCTGNHTVAGTLNVAVDIVLAAAASDCAEEFEIGSIAEAEPGTVMVLDDAGVLQPGSKPYDKKVAGVISGAGSYRPGIVLGRGAGSPTRLPIALVGKVFCKVDAQYGPVEVGDLLTTSPTPGHAMNAQDRSLAFGTVIGKALESLHQGCGLVPILVALQ